MKKFFVFLLIIFGLPCFSTVLTGSIKYSTDDARIELQNNKPSSKFLLTVENFDKNFTQNQSALLKGKTKLNDRTLAQFSDKSYGVNYHNDPTHVYYYDKDGNLINAEIKTSLSYPYRTYKYAPDGELVNMSMRVSEEETFIFSPLGELLGHWVGQNCYDNSEKIIMTRKIMK